MARICFMPSEGEDFELLGTMLIRWGHEIVSVDNGPDFCIAVEERFQRPTPLPDRPPCRSLLLVKDNVSDDDIPSGWERLDEKGCLDQLADVIGMKER